MSVDLIYTGLKHFINLIKKINKFIIQKKEIQDFILKQFEILYKNEKYRFIYEINENKILENIILKHILSDFYMDLSEKIEEELLDYQFSKKEVNVIIEFIKKLNIEILKIQQKYLTNDFKIVVKTIKTEAANIEIKNQFPNKTIHQENRYLKTKKKEVKLNDEIQKFKEYNNFNEIKEELKNQMKSTDAMLRFDVRQFSQIYRKYGNVIAEQIIKMIMLIVEEYLNDFPNVSNMFRLRNKNNLYIILKNFTENTEDILNNCKRIIKKIKTYDWNTISYGLYIELNCGIGAFVNPYSINHEIRKLNNEKEEIYFDILLDRVRLSIVQAKILKPNSVGPIISNTVIKSCIDYDIFDS